MEYNKKSSGVRFYKHGDVLDDISIEELKKALKIVDRIGCSIATMPGVEYHEEIDMICYYWLEPEIKKGQIVLKARFLGNIKGNKLKTNRAMTSANK